MRRNKTNRCAVQMGMEFKNRDNERVTLADGRVEFLSRSVAVVACVICVVREIPYVLMGERGKAVDHSGRWCMPCGYLDWDETLDEAVVREVFEETGLDLTSIEAERIRHYDKRVPHDIISSPKENRQNVANIFGVVFTGPLPKLDASAAISSGEVEQVEWTKLSAIPPDAERAGMDGTFAFKHNERIHHFVDLMRQRGVLL